MVVFVIKIQWMKRKKFTWQKKSMCLSLAFSDHSSRYSISMKWEQKMVAPIQASYNPKPSCPILYIYNFFILTCCTILWKNIYSESYHSDYRSIDSHSWLHSPITNTTLKLEPVTSSYINSFMRISMLEKQTYKLYDIIGLHVLASHGLSPLICSVIN